MHTTDIHDASPIAVPSSMRRAFNDYCDLLDGLAGRDLLGVTAFGPVLEPGFEQTGLAATTVVVLRKVDLLVLRRLAEHGPHLGRLGIAAPQTMTPEYIVSSLDTYPLEMLEIHQHRVTLRGADFFEEVDIRPEHLRLQCEREFKRVLLRLRQGLLAAAGQPDFLLELEHDIGHHLMRTLRGMLWLKGTRTYLPTPAALDACEVVVGRGLPGVREAMRPDAQGSWEEFVALYDDAESLATLVNGSMEDAGI